MFSTFWTIHHELMQALSALQGKRRSLRGLRELTRGVLSQEGWCFYSVQRTCRNKRCNYLRIALLVY